MFHGIGERSGEPFLGSADLHAVRCLGSLFFTFLILSGFAQEGSRNALLQAEEAFRLAPPEERFDRAIDLSTAYRRSQLLDSAWAVAERAMAAAVTDSERANGHFALARVLKEQGELTRVQEHARQAILFARAAKDTLAWLRGEGILSEVDLELERFDASRERVMRMLPVARSLMDSTSLSLVFSTLSNVHYIRHRYDSARAYLDSAVRIIPRAHAHNQLVLRINLVNMFIEEERYDSALARSTALREEVMHWEPDMRVQYFNQRGYAYFCAGRFREAIAEFHRSDSVNEATIDRLDLRIENTGFLAESFAAIGDSGAAYLLMRDLEVLKDSFDRAANDERMLQLEKQFETKLNKEEIARLDQENRQKAERLRARNVQLLGSLAIAVLAIAGSVLVWRNLRQKRGHATVLEGLNAELKDQKEHIEEINRLLRLKVLRTQMNPHFIYNSLNAIHNLVHKGESAAASSYLNGFARLLRMVLDHSVKDRVPLEEEIAFLRHYLELEALRFENGLSWSVEADPILLEEDHLVPALIVQPFVENAVWHGLAPKAQDRALRVRFRPQGERLLCVVEDNGVGRRAAPERAHPDGSRSIGLQLTNERLQLLAYKVGDSARVTFTDLTEGDAPAGTRVEILL